MIWTDEAGSFTAPSGLRVEVNLVPEAWCLREVPGAELRALVEKASREMRKAGREWRSTCLAAPMTGDREEVARWLEACLAVRLDDRKGAAMAAVRLLARLRLAGMLLWPAAYAWMPRLVGTGRPGQHVGLEDGLTGFERTILEGRSCRSVPSVMLMACSPAHAIDDISAEAVTAVVCAAAGVPEASPELLLKLPRFLEGGSRTDGTDIAVVEETEKRLRALGGRWAGPSRFGAVAERDDAADWLSAFGDASARTTHKRRSGQDNAFRRLAAYFGQLDAVPRPEDLRRELHFEGPRGFKAWLREAGHPSPTYIGKILVHLSGLFEMLVEQGRMDLNPIRDDDVPAGEPRRSCSDKAEIPREVLDLIREVVRELADHAFAQFDAISDRTWKRAGKPLDGVSPKHRDAGLLPATLRRPTGFGAYGVTLRGCDGSLVRVLSPALPVIVLWLCTVANRSIEPRLADSGEADEFVPDVVVEKSDDGFDRVHAVPRPNTHPLMKVGRSEGAIRVMKQGNQSVVGLYVTSNKSQAGGHADGSDHGRAIPRQDAVLLQALEKVRTWQGALNPVDRLLSRDELREPVMQPTDGLRGKLPRYAFLFRDLRDDKLSQRLEPPNFGRLKRFFDLVLNEVEARLAGFTAGDGSLDMPEASPRIVLERDRWGQPLSCAYSLHCLRVTGLTSLMDAGVPLWIISRLVAGHASYLMTLYYRRLKPEAAMDAIAAAQRRMDEGGADADALAAARASKEKLSTMLVSDRPAQPVGAHQIPGFWLPMHDGLCPNGATLCHEGGPVPAGGRSHGPVEGGARNCALCRHFLTGPRFLPGQVALANASLFKARRQAQGVQALWIQRRAEQDGRRRARLGDSIARAEAELDLTIRAVNARVRLIHKSLALADLDAAGGARAGDTPRTGDLLITRMGEDDVRASLRQASELGFLDEVSRIAALIPETDVQDAHLDFASAVDRLLDRDGFKAILFKMPRGEARAAGWALVDGVREQAPGGLDPHAFLDDFAEGRRNLYDLDIGRIEGEMALAVGRQIRLQLPAPDDAAPPARHADFRGKAERPAGLHNG